jgi:hypothetical protein
MAELAPFYHDDKNGLDYILVGDYYIPALLPDPQPEGMITRYGRMREKFLKEYHHGIYSAYLMKGQLKQHLLDIQEQAEQRMDILMEQMAKAEGVNEQLKADDQMAWVGRMNNIKYRAEEIVRDEIIYSLHR